MINRIITKVAYHESGHAFMASSCGFKVNKIKLYADDSGSGYTDIDYLGHKNLINTLLDFKGKEDYFAGLPSFIKKNSLSLAQRMCQIIYAGPIAQGVYELDELVKDKIDGVDLLHMNSLLYFYDHLKSSYSLEKLSKENFVESNFNCAHQVIIGNWEKIKKIAENLLNTSDFQLNDIEIV